MHSNNAHTMNYEPSLPVRLAATAQQRCDPGASCRLGSPSFIITKLPVDPLNHFGEAFAINIGCISEAGIIQGWRWDWDLTLIPHLVHDMASRGTEDDDSVC